MHFVDTLSKSNDNAFKHLFFSAHTSKESNPWLWYALAFELCECRADNELKPIF